MNKKLFFWQHPVLFRNVLSFSSIQLQQGSTIFQLFNAVQIILFVKAPEIPFCLPFNFFVRLKTSTTHQLSKSGNR